MDIARRMVEFHRKFPFTFVLMLGDNMYGNEAPSDYYDKFEEPYKPLLAAGVKFYASLGNHDERAQRFYERFNMKGETYYTFKPPTGSVRFFALESDYVDQRQLAWLEAELQNSGSDWKIPFFHHPIYSSGGRHGPDLALRRVLEPLFVKYGVEVAFAGHEHFYERMKPQNGVCYFTAGSAGKLRAGNIKKSPETAVGFDRDNAFMLVEIAGDELYFQTISRGGETVDAGVLQRREAGQRASITNTATR